MDYSHNTSSPSTNNRKALFLDRDGVINIDKGYVSKQKDFEFTPEIFKILKEYTEKGFLIFIITNQSGIARGMFTTDEFNKLTKWMVNKLDKKGIPIKKVYFCPHHPDFSGKCNCRKPEPGLILQAIKEFDINPEFSILIGDKETDLIAGKRAGIGKNLYINDLINL